MKNSNHPLLFASLFFIVLMATLHFSAIVFMFYWRFAWFDNVMHFLGGVWLLTTIIWLLNFSTYEFLRPLRRWPKQATVYLSVLAISISWEVFEYVLGVTYANRYIEDTTSDLFLAMAGALTAGLIFKRLKLFAPDSHE